MRLGKVCNRFSMSPERTEGKWTKRKEKKKKEMKDREGILEYDIARACV